MWKHPGHERDADAFIKAITEHPEDDLPKLVFADWLEENGYHNAAQGMRFAGQYHKRPLDPRDSHSFSASSDNNPDPRNSMSGWFGPTLGNTPENDTFINHRIPNALLSGHGSTSMSYYGDDSDKRVHRHWQDYLKAAHNTEFDDDNHPKSRYKENRLGYQSDIDFPRPRS